MYIDTHCHLPMLINEKSVLLDSIIDEMNENAVKSAFNILSSRSESEFYLEHIKSKNIKSPLFFNVAGIHPHEAESYDEDISWIYEIKDEIIAIGESGMDLYYEFSSEKKQVELFLKMIELSIELDKPLIIHGREAEMQIIEILENDKVFDKNVVFHCFTGGVETAKKIVDNGWYVSFSGILTFKKSHGMRDVLKRVPLERMFFETDSPFLAPHPYRGKTNSPGKVKYIYEFVSEFLDISNRELSEQILSNISTFFNIDLK